MTKSCKEEIICIGEILWDSLPSGLFLGGAPLNVSLHLSNLNERVAIASRVGDDRLGHESLRRIKNRDLSVNLIQKDINRETGFVKVTIDDNGNPTYEVVEPVAWDGIELSEALLSRVDDAWAIVFGSLAQRSETSRNTIQQLCEGRCLKVFDINLRTPFIDHLIIEQSLSKTDILKLNKYELSTLRRWYKLPGNIQEAVLALSIEFNIPIITLTCGNCGSALLYRNEWFEHPGFKINVADTVGSGDAFLAALLYGLKSGEPGDVILKLANAAGAYVASQNGAAPEYDVSMIRQIIQRNDSENITW